MKKDIKRNDALLLPNKFKLIGGIIVGLSIVMLITVKFSTLEFDPSIKNILRLINLNSFILGLLMIAASKDLTEDELTIQLRLKSMAWAFISTVIMVVFKPLIDLIFQDPLKDFSSHQIVIIMLLGFIFMYYQQKQNR